MVTDTAVGTMIARRLRELVALRGFRFALGLAAVQPLYALASSLVHGRLSLSWFLIYVGAFVSLAALVLRHQWTEHSATPRPVLLRIWFAAIVLLISSHVSNVLVDDWLHEGITDGKTAWHALSALLATLAAVGSASYLYKNRSSIRIGLRGLAPADSEPPSARCLILFLSELNAKVAYIQSGAVVSAKTGDAIAIPSGVSRRSKILAIQDSVASQWRMPLEAIDWHVEHRQHAAPISVIMICSTESGPQSQAFGEIVKDLFSDDVRFRVLALIQAQNGAVHHQLLEQRDPPETDMNRNPIGDLETGHRINILDFADFRAVWYALDGLIERVLHQDGIRESDIMVDFTGGYKTTSVVGTLATIDREVRAQYVHTGTYKVLSWNLRQVQQPGLE